MRLTEDRSAPDLPEGGEESVLLPRRQDGTPLRCLVVEDEGLIALDIADRLREWGAETEIAPTVAAALRLLDEFEPDLVLLDVRLPDGDGISLAARLRSLSPVAIVFVTSMTTPEAVRRMRQLGDFLLVPKPVDFRQLRRAIQGALAG